MKWKEIIKKSKKRGKFTLKNKKLSHHFDTCVISEISKEKDNNMFIRNFLINKYGVKKGDKLMSLGYDFCHKGVMNDNMKLSQQIYNEIQKLKV